MHRQLCAEMHIDDLLIHMEARDASDLYLKNGVPPMLRIAGNLVPAGEGPLTDEAVYGLAEQLMTDPPRPEFAGVPCGRHPPGEECHPVLRGSAAATGRRPPGPGSPGPGPGDRSDGVGEVPHPGRDDQLP